MTKRLTLMRGPELIHNQLIHKQYGIVVSFFLYLCFTDILLSPSFGLLSRHFAVGGYTQVTWKCYV